jgi:putative redox protein
MKADLKWLGGVAFEATTGSGHTLVMDGAPEFGGGNRGPRPMELLLAGLAGCSAFDVVHILRKGRHEVSDCRVSVQAERAETPPQVFTRIHLHFEVGGEGLTDVQVERAIRLSAEKYCSASIMLGQTAEITHDFSLV